MLPTKTGATLRRHQSKQDYATPWEFIRAVEHVHGAITFDLAADAENTKAEKYYSVMDDSLVQPWHTLKGNLWLNPPFGNIAPWARKCSAEARLGARIFFLTPASIGSNWFRDHVHKQALVLGLNGRIQFDGANPYPKDCVLSLYGLPETGFDVWTWPDDVPPAA